LITITLETSLKELAVIVCNHLQRHGIEAVLTGGAVVSIYTGSAYKSFDLDFISWVDNKALQKAMEDLGFKKDAGRYYVHPGTNFYVEFPAPPLSIGNQPIHTWNIIESNHGTLKLLTPTHCVMDRLAAFYYWKDFESLEQALLVALCQDIDLAEIQAWSEKEGMQDKYIFFLNKLKTQKKQ